VEGLCEHGYEPSVSIKRWEVFEWLDDRWLLKKCPVPWSNLVMGLVWDMQTELEHLFLKLHCQRPAVKFLRNIRFSRWLKTPGEFVKECRMQPAR
jgi:hypothetical protein